MCAPEKIAITRKIIALIVRDLREAGCDFHAAVRTG